MRYTFNKSETTTHIKAKDTHMILGSSPKYIIYLVHGYRGDFNWLIRLMSPLSSFENILIARASIGYEGRNGSIHDWIGSIEDHKQYINQNNMNKLPIIYIGHSLGGVLGLNMLSLKNIIQCYCMGVPYDLAPIESSNLRKANNFLRNQFRIGNPSNFMKKERMSPAIPKNLTLSNNEAQKIHLIYGENDPYVNIDSMRKIAKKFTIPAERCFIEKTKIYSFHNTLLLSKGIKAWIEKNIHSQIQ
jgi:predicted alpha/beta hydrolase family esterase